MSSDYGAAGSVCGKNRYPDKKTALTVRNHRTSMHHGRQKTKSLRVYHCPDCNGWHLAHRA